LSLSTQYTHITYTHQSAAKPSKLLKWSKLIQTHYHFTARIFLQFRKYTQLLPKSSHSRLLCGLE